MSLHEDVLRLEGDSSLFLSLGGVDGDLVELLILLLIEWFSPSSGLSSRKRGMDVIVCVLFAAIEAFFSCKSIFNIRPC